MTDPNRSIADELQEVERELAKFTAIRRHMKPRTYWRLKQRAAALRSDFASLAYAGRKP